MLLPVSSASTQQTHSRIVKTLLGKSWPARKFVAHSPQFERDGPEVVVAIKVKCRGGGASKPHHLLRLMTLIVVFPSCVKWDSSPRRTNCSRSPGNPSSRTGPPSQLGWGRILAFLPWGRVEIFGQWGRRIIFWSCF